MKKWNVLLGLTLAGALCVAAAGSEYTPGVTVAEDPESPTGYTVTFAYEDAAAEKVQLRGAFTFFYDEEGVRGTTPETSYTPQEWANGMFEAGDESLTIDMEKVEGTDLWLPPCRFPTAIISMFS